MSIISSGMEGHARAADIRLEKYFPGEKFDLHPVKVKSSFVWFNIFIGFTCSEFVRKLNGTISKIKLNRPILLNSSFFKLQILQLLLSLLWNFSWFKKPNDPLLTSRWF